jgi:hypothetical protein
MNAALVYTAQRLPARLDSQAAAAFLGLQDHDLPVLARARLLKPLANPAPNAPKYYATCELAELAQDRAWLSRVTSALAAHWQRKNANKNTARSSSPLTRRRPSSPDEASE